MNIQEFTDRTGFRPTDDYYHNVIELEYMRSKLEKDAFCKQWKRNGGIQKAYDAMSLEAANNFSEAITIKASFNELEVKAMKMSDSLEVKDETIRLLKDELDNRDKKMSDIESFLVWQAEQYMSRDLRAKAVELMGEKAYISYKINHDIALWDEDKQIVINLLNQ